MSFLKSDKGKFVGFRSRVRGNAQQNEEVSTSLSQIRSLCDLNFSYSVSRLWLLEGKRTNSLKSYWSWSMIWKSTYLELEVRDEIDEKNLRKKRKRTSSRDHWKSKLKKSKLEVLLSRDFHACVFFFSCSQVALKEFEESHRVQKEH